LSGSGMHTMYRSYGASDLTVVIPLFGLYRVLWSSDFESYRIEEAS